MNIKSKSSYLEKYVTNYARIMKIKSIHLNLRNTPTNDSQIMNRSRNLKEKNNVSTIFINKIIFLYILLVLNLFFNALKFIANTYTYTCSWNSIIFHAKIPKVYNQMHSEISTKNDFWKIWIIFWKIWKSTVTER